MENDTHSTGSAPFVAAREHGSRPAHLQVPARLIEYTRQRYIALPPHVTIELVEEPALVEIPGAAYYSRGLLKWRSRWLPVIDLHTLLRAYPTYVPVQLRYVLVVAYPAEPRQDMQYGGLALPALPQKIDVGDDSQCALPTDSDLWPLIALSCFRHDGFAIPIVDCGRIFNVSHG